MAVTSLSQFVSIIQALHNRVSDAVILDLHTEEITGLLVMPDRESPKFVACVPSFVPFHNGTPVRARIFVWKLVS
jgi:hypothetical protein